MNKPIRWLHEQLPAWVAQGTISPAQAETLRRLYPEPRPVLPWGMLLFSGLGAIILGFGVILLLAYNWEAMPKFSKLALIFGALLTAHAAGVRLLPAPDWRRHLGESLCLLGTMLFGSGIWLVAQVYHIDEHYPTGFLLWGAGALLLGWALPSVAHGALAALVMTAWGASETFGFRDPMHGAPLLLGVGVGGLAWNQGSRVLLAVVLGGVYFLLLANTAEARSELAFPVALNLSVLLLALARWAGSSAHFPGSAGVLRFFGWAGFLVLVYLLSFHDVVHDVLRWHERLVDEERWAALVGYGWGPWALGLAAWAGWAVQGWRWSVNSPETVSAAGHRGWRQVADRISEEWLVPFTAVFSQGMAFALPLAGDGMIPASQQVIAAVFNLVFLAVAGMWMARGCRQGELKPMVLGSVLLLALVAARYFDLFESLAWRGLTFLIVGGVVFTEGFFYRRARQQAEQRREQP